MLCGERDLLNCSDVVSILCTAEDKLDIPVYSLDNSLDRKWLPNDFLTGKSYMLEKSRLCSVIQLSSGAWHGVLRSGGGCGHFYNSVKKMYRGYNYWGWYLILDLFSSVSFTVNSYVSVMTNHLSVFLIPTDSLMGWPWKWLYWILNGISQGMLNVFKHLKMS